MTSSGHRSLPCFMTHVLPETGVAEREVHGVPIGTKHHASEVPIEKRLGTSEAAELGVNVIEKESAFHASMYVGPP